MDTKEKRQAPASRRRAAGARPRRRSAPSQARGRQRSDIPEVVYTQPPAFNRSGFLTRIATVVAVVLALTLGMSIFFKVETVAVSGNRKYSAWDVRQASGIQEGDSLLTLSKAMVAGKIRAELPYADNVRIGIKLPDTVNIEITELDVAYAIQGQGGWWLINADGKLLEIVSAEQALAYTCVLGVTVTEGQPGQQAVAYEPQQETTDEADPESDDETGPEESTAPPEETQALLTIPASQRLDAAVSILQTLESNNIIGDVTSIDVTAMDQITLWYEDRYRVTLGDSSQLDRKIRAMKEAANQMTDYQTGELDVSFTTWADQVIFTPFADEET